MSSANSKVLAKKLSQKKQEIGEDDWENHMVIRFPSDIANIVNEIILADVHTNDRLAINFEGDLRNGAVRVDNRILPFKIYDLPCVTEVFFYILLFNTGLA